MTVEVTSGARTVVFNFDPQHTAEVLSFYNELLQNYEITAYKATLDDGTIVRQVVA